MALNAQFIADFSSFYSAVQQAESHLADFQSGARRVEGSLNQMVDSFSGRKVMQDATLMVEAVERVGGVGKLTTDEFDRLQRTVGTAADKMTRMGVEVPPEIQKIADEVRGLQKPLDDAGTSFGTFGRAVMASLVSTELRRFATDVRRFANEFIGAFAEEEAAVSRLTAALRANDTYTPELVKSYQALGTEFQNTTRFSDELIISSAAMLVQVGQVLPSQMRAALVAITNLAAGMGPSVGGLEGATLLVAKAFSEGGESLGKLKVILGDSLKPGADMAEVLEAINSKFRGQAAADRATALGQFEALKNQMSDFNEKVGKLLVEGLTPLLNVFSAMPQPMQTAVLGIIAIGTAVAPLSVSFLALKLAIAPLIPMIGTALVAAIGAISAPVAICIAAAAALLVAFYKWREIVDIAKYVYEGVKNWLVDKFDAIVAWVQARIAAIIAAFQAMYMAITGGSIVPDMIADIASEFGKLNDVMVQPVIRATRIVTDEFAGTGSAVLAGSVGMAGASAGGGSISIPITINGSVLSNANEIARVVGDAVTQSLRQQGWRAPA